MSAYLLALNCTWGRLGSGNPVLCFPSKRKMRWCLIYKGDKMFCLLSSPEWSWPVLVILRGFEPACNLKALNPFHQQLFVVSFSHVCHSPARTVYCEAPLHEFMKFTRTMQLGLWFPVRPLKQFGLWHCWMRPPLFLPSSASSFRKCSAPAGFWRGGGEWSEEDSCGFGTEDWGRGERLWVWERL